MTNWRTRKGLYMIREINKKGYEDYPMLATGAEIAAWCKAKNEIYGYVEGQGGDRSYSCFAWLLEYKD